MNETPSPIGDADRFGTRGTMFDNLRDTDEARRALAWAGFQVKYAPIIAGFARKLGVAPHDLDDVAQEVTMQFFQSASAFAYDPARGRFRGYLKTVTYRTIRDRFRAGRGSGRIAGVPLDDIDPADPRVEAHWNAVWDRERLAAALEVVAIAYGRNTTYQAFERHDLAEEDVASVAGALGMTVDAVYKSAQRVRAAVKREVERMEATDDA